LNISNDKKKGKEKRKELIHQSSYNKQQLLTSFIRGARGINHLTTNNNFLQASFAERAGGCM